MSGAKRVVFDCNVFFQALISPAGPAGRCVEAVCVARVRLFCSTQIIEEFRDVADRPKLVARFGITADRVGAMVGLVREIAEIVDDAPRRFEFPRDPDDAHYVDLALEVDASLIVTRDNDLLDLGDPATADGREFHDRFPGLRIVQPTELLASLRAD